jgi:hypothetical protein
VFDLVRIFSLPDEQAGAKPVDMLQKIFVVIRAKTDNDFSWYKHNTVVCVIERRIAVLQIENQTDYAAYLRNTPQEIERLGKAMNHGSPYNDFVSSPSDWRPVTGANDMVMHRLSLF